MLEKLTFHINYHSRKWYDGLFMRSIVKFRTTQHLSGCLEMLYIWPVRANTLPLKVRDPLNTKSAMARPVRTHSEEHPSLHSLLAPMRVIGAIVGMIHHHLSVYGAWHLLDFTKCARMYKCMCACRCLPVSGHWVDQWEEGWTHAVWQKGMFSKWWHFSIDFAFMGKSIV